MRHLPRKQPLTLEQILAWADAHHLLYGCWPTMCSTPAPVAAGCTWSGIDSALRRGSRGLAGGSSLARLLEARRGVRNQNPAHKRRLTVAGILRRAERHRRRTGRWPTKTSGPLAGLAGETWNSLNAALWIGHRGLPGGSSLAKVFSEYRGRRYRKCPLPLTLVEILTWAQAHQQRTGGWPTQDSGPVTEVDGETWWAIDHGLKCVTRGLPVRTTLHRLIHLCRNVLLRVHPEIPLSDGVTWGGTPAEVTARILIREANEEAVE
jgi:hypothetical protein